jgi:hypothetical protein
VNFMVSLRRIHSHRLENLESDMLCSGLPFVLPVRQLHWVVLCLKTNLTGDRSLNIMSIFQSSATCFLVPSLRCHASDVTCRSTNSIKAVCNIPLMGKLVCISLF